MIVYVDWSEERILNIDEAKVVFEEEYLSEFENTSSNFEYWLEDNYHISEVWEMSNKEKKEVYEKYKVFAKKEAFEEFKTDFKEVEICTSVKNTTLF